MAGYCARLDEAAHRRGVADKLTMLGIGGVGVSIEMDEGELAGAVNVCDPPGVGERDRVVSAEYDGWGAVKALYRDTPAPR